MHTGVTALHRRGIFDVRKIDGMENVSAFKYRHAGLDVLE